VACPPAGTVPPNVPAAGSALRVFAFGTPSSALEYTGRFSESLPVFLAVIVKIVACPFTRTDDPVTVRAPLVWEAALRIRSWAGGGGAWWWRVGVAWGRRYCTRYAKASPPPPHSTMTRASTPTMRAALRGCRCRWGAGQ